MKEETRMFALDLFDKVFKTIIRDDAFEDPAAYDIAAGVQDIYLKEINERCPSRPKSTYCPQSKGT